MVNELVDIYLRLKMKKARDSQDKSISSYVREKEELNALPVATLIDYIKHAIQIFLEMHELASEAQNNSHCKFKLKKEYRLEEEGVSVGSGITNRPNSLKKPGKVTDIRQREVDSSVKSVPSAPSIYERELQRYE